MLSKINRIKNKKDFEVIFERGISFQNSFFILKLLKNNLGYNRFGFVISQKVSKKATERNKIKRILSEIIRDNFKDIKKGLDIVFISLASVNKKEFLEIKESLLDVMGKAKIIKKDKE